VASTCKGQPDTRTCARLGSNTGPRRSSGGTQHTVILLDTIRNQSIQRPPSQFPPLWTLVFQIDIFQPAHRKLIHHDNTVNSNYRSEYSAGSVRTVTQQCVAFGQPLLLWKSCKNYIHTHTHTHIYIYIYVSKRFSTLYDT
jgi:hypothetical protein